MKKILSLFVLFSIVFSSVIILINRDSVKADETPQPWKKQTELLSVWDFEQITGENYNRVKPNGWYLTPNGTILLFPMLFFEDSDAGLEVFLMKSFDNGSTWTEPVLFCNNHYDLGYYDPQGKRWQMDILGIDNPYHIHEDRTYVGFCYRSYQLTPTYIYMIYTEDNGETWVGINTSNHTFTKDCIDVNTQAGSPDVYYPYSGQGIITSQGRLIYPAYRYLETHNIQIGTWYSDDWYENGTNSTWVATPWYGASGSTNMKSEGTIVELTNGTLFRICRNREAFGGVAHPHYAWSEDAHGNITWTTGTDFPYFSEFVSCEETMEVKRVTLDTEYEKNRVIFIWNNDTYVGSSNQGRNTVTCAISTDECQTWDYSRVVFEPDNVDSGFHPKVFVTANKTFIACCYDKSLYDCCKNNTMRLSHFNIEWLSNGQDTLNQT